jgi:hypothetical protein
MRLQSALIGAETFAIDGQTGPGDVSGQCVDGPAVCLEASANDLDDDELPLYKFNSEQRVILARTLILTGMAEKMCSCFTSPTPCA